MKKLIALLILALFLLETSCYQPPGQTWQPRGHGPISTKKPRAYRR
jgi:hypothetical protein